VPETLKFHFTPADVPVDGAPNVHAKASTRVMDTVEALQRAMPDVIQNIYHYAGEITVWIQKDRIRDVCTYLKDTLGFQYLADLGGIDQFREEARFEVFYNLVNLETNRRLRLKVRVEESDPRLPSVTPVFAAANWNERECFDMLGLRFDDHPDLRRMYMPEDFEHFPQRKEFPLLGMPGSRPPASTDP